MQHEIAKEYSIMSNPTNPFLDFDFAKAFEMGKSFDFAKAFSDFSKTFGNYKMPEVDMDGLLASQRRNIEALTAANRVAFEGVQAIARRQAELLKQALDEATEASRHLIGAGTPEEKLATQAAIAKDAFDIAIANMREIAEMAAKSNTQALDLVNQRVSESLEEVKTSIARKARKTK